MRSEDEILDMAELAHDTSIGYYRVWKKVKDSPDPIDKRLARECEEKMMYLDGVSDALFWATDISSDLDEVLVYKKELEELGEVI